MHKNIVRTSQEIHYVSAAKTNRLMLLSEITAVYCENRLKQTHLRAECRVLVLPRVEVTVKRGMDKIIGFIDCMHSTRNYK
jgi:hypothetical protein